MPTIAPWEKAKPVARVAGKAQKGVLAVLVRRLKAGVAEIAAVKSLHQCRREEEREQ